MRRLVRVVRPVRISRNSRPEAVFVHTSPSEPRRRTPLMDRLFPILILILVTLAIVLGVTGGVDLRAIGIPFSSRDPLRPTIVAFVLAVIYTARNRAVVAAWLSWCGDQFVKVTPAVAIAL